MNLARIKKKSFGNEIKGFKIFEVIKNNFFFAYSSSQIIQFVVELIRFYSKFITKKLYICEHKI